jgi:hypothetical protein
MPGVLGELGRITMVTTIAGLSAVGAAAILAQADDPARRLTHRIWADSAPLHWRDNVASFGAATPRPGSPRAAHTELADLCEADHGDTQLGTCARFGETGSAATGNPGTLWDEHRVIFVAVSGWQIPMAAHTRTTRRHSRRSLHRRPQRGRRTRHTRIRRVTSSPVSSA